MNNKTRLFDWWILELTKYFAYFGWGVSSIFSYLGAISVSTLPWWMKLIAAIFAVGVNVVEASMGNLSFEELLHPKDINGLVLLLFGLFAYIYDIWTNIAGFCIMFTGTANVSLAWSNDRSLLVWPIIFGVMFAIGPEPLYRYYLSHIFPKPKVDLTQSQSPKQNQHQKHSYRPAQYPESLDPPKPFKPFSEYIKERQQAEHKPQ